MLNTKTRKLARAAGLTSTVLRTAHAMAAKLFDAMAVQGRKEHGYVCIQCCLPGEPTLDLGFQCP